ncbi:MAG: hypothetical protein ACKOPN_06375, partial [Prochlorococcaceae cyanobacterium]
IVQAYAIQLACIDAPGRTLAEVISGITINLVRVDDGQAFAYRRHPLGCDAHGHPRAGCPPRRPRSGRQSAGPHRSP